MIAHLPLVPVLVPIAAAAVLLLLERRHSMRVLRTGAWLSMAVQLAAAVVLLAGAAGGGISVYLVGDWPARIGIALTVDRLSALMLVTTVLLAIPALLYACAGWDRRAPHFHALFQVQMGGLAGAFLTGDVFNLFVFFEVMLVASYGLLLSGGRGERIRAGLHYVVFNVAASTLFLIALGLVYGLLGTLNMAELAVRVREVGADDAPVVRAACGLLLLVFCAKAAMLPMYLWLPDTYARAPAAIAALFTIMTKVGLYALLRMTTLVFGDDAGLLAGFFRAPLYWAGIATLLLGGLGVVGALRLRIGAAYLVLLSAGTLFVAFALATPGSIAAGLYYLPHSCFAAAALFLIAHVVQRERGEHGDKVLPQATPLPALTGLLYLVAAVSLVGLPPLSGFIGKAMLLSATPDDAVPAVFAAVLGSSLLALLGLARTGTRLFWRVDESGDARGVLRESDIAVPVPGPSAPPGAAGPRIRRGEVAAASILLLLGLGMAAAASPVVRYAQATATQLLAPGDYIDAVRAALPRRREP